MHEDEEFDEMDILNSSDLQNEKSEFFKLRNQGSDQFKINSYRNKLKETLRKI